MRFRSVRLSAQRVFFLWVASFAVLLGSLAPTISVALQGAGEPAWAEICTSQGALQGAARGAFQRTSQDVAWDVAANRTADANRQPGHSLAHVFEHCPYCSLHFADLGMPPTGVSPSVPALALADPVFHAAATPTLRLWSDALSRGPPSLV